MLFLFSGIVNKPVCIVDLCTRLISQHTPVTEEQTKTTGDPLLKMGLRCGHTALFVPLTSIQTHANASNRKRQLVRKSDVYQVVDCVVLEQFITRLPKKTAEWVQCHRPTSLDSAIHLAEDHMVACQGVGEPLPSTSPSLLSPSFSRPVPLPRSRPPGPPRVPPWGRGETEQGQLYGPRAPPRGAGLSADWPDPAPASPLSLRQPFNPLSATRAAGRSGPACWHCGDPEHFVDRCPVMEVGTMIRVLEAPKATPGQAGWYQIPTDASDRGLGAVLSQEIEGEERPVLYISRKLSKGEAKYSTVEKGCLAVRWAVLTLRYYLLGWEFTLCSDHAVAPPHEGYQREDRVGIWLYSLLSSRWSTGRVLRWLWPIS
ncbi:uncharacterized protein LOC125261204 [Megalobrama amblycephala]|uniref:uncharacterized protein LOC125261204 n=1 Tax=Megalobrama amblycephala TaxID=75352 RepID=UPI0020141701|nr:uncharacterized protein LOC125261204 [Megalobrama amblycephala]